MEVQVILCLWWSFGIVSGGVTETVVTCGGGCPHDALGH